MDLNHRPLGYEPNELPDCSTPRYGTCPPTLALPLRGGREFPNPGPPHWWRELASLALPLKGRRGMRDLERETGFEPATHSLEGCCSAGLSYSRIDPANQQLRFIARPSQSSLVRKTALRPQIPLSRVGG